MAQPQEWTKADPELRARALGRIARWEARRAAHEAGGETLTLDQLENLILRTQLAALTTEDPMTVATILLRLEDMEREYDRCAFLEEDVTGWPADAG